MIRGIHAAWKRRGLPTNVRGLRHCQVSYSQFGEDLIAEAVFGSNYSGGAYVDVGCFDPQKWSNTYRFYQKGWTGLCIDPNRVMAPAWKRVRSRDTFLNVAIGTDSGTIGYVQNERFPQENRVASVDDECPESVRCERLDAVLAKHWDASKTIDLMSIDCEGHDLVVLRSNDLERFRPRVLIVEDHARLNRSAIDEYCELYEYRLVGFTALSKVFGDLRWFAERRKAATTSPDELHQQTAAAHV